MGTDGRAVRNTGLGSGGGTCGWCWAKWGCRCASGHSQDPPFLSSQHLLRDLGGLAGETTE